jgi:hypothetical protein
MNRLLADCCPRCLEVNSPDAIRHDRSSIRASYVCRSCHWHWTCWWNESCLEVGVSDRDSIAKVQSIPHRARNRKPAEA